MKSENTHWWLHMKFKLMVYCWFQTETLINKWLHIPAKDELKPGVFVYNVKRNWMQGIWGAYESIVRKRAPYLGFVLWFGTEKNLQWLSMDCLLLVVLASSSTSSFPIEKVFVIGNQI